MTITFVNSSCLLLQLLFSVLRLTGLVFFRPHTRRTDVAGCMWSLVFQGQTRAGAVLSQNIGGGGASPSPSLPSSSLPLEVVL